jgi:hypothetical protein
MCADDAEVVIDMQPGLPDGHYHKGFACFALHDYAAAVSCCCRHSPICWLAQSSTLA